MRQVLPLTRRPMHGRNRREHDSAARAEPTPRWIERRPLPYGPDAASQQTDGPIRSRTMPPTARAAGKRNDGSGHRVNGMGGDDRARWRGRRRGRRRTAPRPARDDGHGDDHPGPRGREGVSARDVPGRRDVVLDDHPGRVGRDRACVREDGAGSAGNSLRSPRRRSAKRLATGRCRVLRCGSWGSHGNHRRHRRPGARRGPGIGAIERARPAVARIRRSRGSGTPVSGPVTDAATRLWGARRPVMPAMVSLAVSQARTLTSRLAAPGGYGRCPT